MHFIFDARSLNGGAPLESFHTVDINDLIAPSTRQTAKKGDPKTTK